MGAHLTANATVSAHDARVVVPSDATVIPVTRALFVGTTGNITVRMADETQVLFSNVPVGVFPIQVDMVMSTGTTASNMVAMY